MKYFQIEIKHGAMVYQLLNEIFPEDTASDDKPRYFESLISDNSKHTLELLDKLKKIATDATVIPLLVFTNLFHQRFPKHRYLESTLELLK
jgi:hypothetical protein